MSQADDYRLQLFTYGPFDIPNKSKWIIVGSGPSAQEFLDLELNDDIGIIALSATIQVIKKADINIHSHWETVFTSWEYFDRAERVYIPNPISVGYRCVPIDTMNILNHEDVINHFMWKIRMYTKRIALGMKSDSLYAKETVATVALDLLAKAGIKDVIYCGIDGGVDAPRAVGFKDLSPYKNKFMTHPEYDRCAKDFFWFAEAEKISLTSLSKFLVSA